MSASQPMLSGVVTTFNNAETLDRCLASMAFCDELVVLDSGSTDGSQAIAEAHHAKLFIEDFKGYGPQKQSAIDKCSGEWILLLDADEFLAPGAAEIIRDRLAAPDAEGYRLSRDEWLFWRWPAPGTRGNRQLRLFNKSVGAMNAVPVHAAPEVNGQVRDLDARFMHFGEPELAVRVEKINRYSSGLVAHSARKQKRFMAARLIFYPWIAFLKMYIGKRYFLNGWAGFFAARTHAFYAFLKYAKVHEARQKSARDQAL